MTVLILLTILSLTLGIVFSYCILLGLATWCTSSKQLNSSSEKLVA